MGANYSDAWDDDESGGTACARGRHCSERDYQGNAARGPRPWCETDRGLVGTVIRDLPQTYAELHSKLARQQKQGGERVSGGGKEAPVPLDLGIEAFLRHIILVAVSWEERVREAASLSNPDVCPSCDADEPDVTRCRACRGTGVVRARDGAALKRACVLLAGHDRDRQGHLTTLLALSPEDMARPVSLERLAALEPGSVIRDSAGDTWERGELDGTAAGLEFLDVNSRARSVLGLNLQSRRVAVRCDVCESIGTLKQREALAGGYEPVVRCTAEGCGEVYTGTLFESLIAREYEATLKAGRAS